jgi:hypothetical protein
MNEKSSEKAPGKARLTILQRLALLGAIGIALAVIFSFLR